MFCRYFPAVRTIRSSRPLMLDKAHHTVAISLYNVSRTSGPSDCTHLWNRRESNPQNGVKWWGQTAARPMRSRNRVITRLKLVVDFGRGVYETRVQGQTPGAAPFPAPLSHASRCQRTLFVPSKTRLFACFVRYFRRS